MRAHSLLPGAAAAIAMAAALASCSAPTAADDGPRLIQPGDGSGAGWLEWDMAIGDTFLNLSAIRLCVTEPGQVTITDITFATGGGIAVGAFATSPAADATQRQSRPDAVTLSETDWDTAQRTVSTVCPTSFASDGAAVGGDLTWLALELRKGSPGVSSGVTMQVHYESGGTEYVLPLNLFYALCETELECDQWYATASPDW